MKLRPVNNNLKQLYWMVALAAILALLAACQSQATKTAAPLTPSETPAPTDTLSPADVGDQSRPTATVTVTAEPTPTLHPDAWRDAPVIPSLDPAILEIYQRGLERGNDPRAFSKLGDSETFTTWFLAPFDQSEDIYRLGEYEHLQDVIDYYAGSYARQSIAARPGFNASSVFAPMWADPELCESGETPIACEFRIHQPSVVFILLGTNDLWHQEDYEAQMRRIIEYALEQGVIPVLGSKADNLEGDHSLNRTLYALSVEYRLPFWNFWAAVQGIPDNGLDEDNAHLTFAPNHFDDPQAMRRAWPIRNLTALQVLYELMQFLQSE
jgi:hypothetical protein